MGRRVVVLIAVTAVLAVAIVTDVRAHTRATHEQQVLARTQSSLSAARFGVSEERYALALAAAKLKQLQVAVGNTESEAGGTNSSLATSDQSVFIQGLYIGMLHSCLGGVKSALQDIKAGQNALATTDISGVSAACLSVNGDSAGGPVYPFDFPDPFVLRFGSTYYGYATNSAEGNIQIIASTNLTQWTTVGNALPRLPSWAEAGGTWAPSVLQVGGTFVLYYSAVVAGLGGGEECISAATSGSPTGPFVDNSTFPLECQTPGSIDPSLFTTANGISYLQWKSDAGSGQPAALWSEQLNAAGTGFAPGTTATELTTANVGWEDGIVEAPDLVLANGRYYLFFSGNNWNSTNYAVGVALCSGPLGPCNTVTTPILRTGSSMSGPGGETVFVDASGNLWMGFAAWLPGSVGYPHSRELYLRQLSFSGTTPVVPSG
jgi:hypothetical protein